MLRQVRERQGLSLRSLATRAGFSASFLSQLENGQVSPSIASLARIASQLGVTLADLFEATEDRPAIVVRADARPGFISSWSRARIESLVAAGGRRPFEALCVTLAPQGLHVMFMGLEAPLAAGASIPATLVFERAGEIAIEFEVEPRAAEAVDDMPGMTH